MDESRKLHPPSSTINISDADLSNERHSPNHGGGEYSNDKNPRLCSDHSFYNNKRVAKMRQEIENMQKEHTVEIARLRTQLDNAHDKMNTIYKEKVLAEEETTRLGKTCQAKENELRQAYNTKTVGDQYLRVLEGSVEDQRQDIEVLRAKNNDLLTRLAIAEIRINPPDDQTQMDIKNLQQTIESLEQNLHDCEFRPQLYGEYQEN